MRSRPPGRSTRAASLSAWARPPAPWMLLRARLLTPARQIRSEKFERYSKGVQLQGPQGPQQGRQVLYWLPPSGEPWSFGCVSTSSTARPPGPTRSAEFLGIISSKYPPSDAHVGHARARAGQDCSADAIAGIPLSTPGRGPPSAVVRPPSSSSPLFGTDKSHVRPPRTWGYRQQPTRSLKCLITPSGVLATCAPARVVHCPGASSEPGGAWPRGRT